MAVSQESGPVGAGAVNASSTPHITTSSPINGSSTTPAGGVANTCKPSFVPVVIDNKVLSCIERGADREQFALVEALSRLYFPSCTVQRFRQVWEQDLGLPVSALSREEEQAFILFYDLPTNRLLCNKVVKVQHFQEAFTKLKDVVNNKQPEVKATGDRKRHASPIDTVSAKRPNLKSADLEQSVICGPKKGDIAKEEIENGNMDSQAETMASIKLVAVSGVCGGTEVDDIMVVDAATDEEVFSLPRNDTRKDPSLEGACDKGSENNEMSVDSEFIITDTYSIENGNKDLPVSDETNLETGCKAEPSPMDTNQTNVACSASTVIVSSTNEPMQTDIINVISTTASVAGHPYPELSCIVSPGNAPITVTSPLSVPISCANMKDIKPVMSVMHNATIVRPDEATLASQSPRDRDTSPVLSYPSVETVTPAHPEEKRSMDENSVVQPEIPKHISGNETNSMQINPEIIAFHALPEKNSPPKDHTNVFALTSCIQDTLTQKSEASTSENPCGPLASFAVQEPSQNTTGTCVSQPPVSLSGRLDSQIVPREPIMTSLPRMSPCSDELSSNSVTNKDPKPSLPSVDGKSSPVTIDICALKNRARELFKNLKLPKYITGSSPSSPVSASSSEKLNLGTPSRPRSRSVETPPTNDKVPKTSVLECISNGPFRNLTEEATGSKTLSEPPLATSRQTLDVMYMAKQSPGPNEYSEQHDKSKEPCTVTERIIKNVSHSSPIATGSCVPGENFSPVGISNKSVPSEEWSFEGISKAEGSGEISNDMPKCASELNAVTQEALPDSGDIMEGDATDPAPPSFPNETEDKHTCNQLDLSKGTPEQDGPGEVSNDSPKSPLSLTTMAEEPVIDSVDGEEIDVTTSSPVSHHDGSGEASNDTHTSPLSPTTMVSEPAMDAMDTEELDVIHCDPISHPSGNEEAHIPVQLDAPPVKPNDEPAHPIQTGVTTSDTNSLVDGGDRTQVIGDGEAATHKSGATSIVMDTDVTDDQTSEVNGDKDVESPCGNQSPINSPHPVADCTETESLEGKAYIDFPVLDAPGTMASHDLQQQLHDGPATPEDSCTPSGSCIKAVSANECDTQSVSGESELDVVNPIEVMDVAENARSTNIVSDNVQSLNPMNSDKEPLDSVPTLNACDYSKRNTSDKETAQIGPNINNKSIEESIHTLQETEFVADKPIEESIHPLKEMESITDKPMEESIHPLKEVESITDKPMEESIHPLKEVESITDKPMEESIHPLKEVESITDKPMEESIHPLKEVESITDKPMEESIHPLKDVESITDKPMEESIHPLKEVESITDKPMEESIHPLKEVESITDKPMEESIHPLKEVESIMDKPMEESIHPLGKDESITDKPIDESICTLNEMESRTNMPIGESIHPSKEMESETHLDSVEGSNPVSPGDVMGCVKGPDSVSPDDEMDCVKGPDDVPPEDIMGCVKGWDSVSPGAETTLSDSQLPGLVASHDSNSEVNATDTDIDMTEKSEAPILSLTADTEQLATLPEPSDHIVEKPLAPIFDPLANDVSLQSSIPTNDQLSELAKEELGSHDSMDVGDGLLASQASPSTAVSAAQPRDLAAQAQSTLSTNCDSTPPTVSEGESCDAINSVPSDRDLLLADQMTPPGPGITATQEIETPCPTDSSGPVLDTSIVEGCVATPNLEGGHNPVVEGEGSAEPEQPMAEKPAEEPMDVSLTEDVPAQSESSDSDIHNSVTPVIDDTVFMNNEDSETSAAPKEPVHSNNMETVILEPSTEPPSDFTETYNVSVSSKTVTHVSQPEASLKLLSQLSSELPASENQSNMQHQERDPHLEETDIAHEPKNSFVQEHPNITKDIGHSPADENTLAVVGEQSSGGDPKENDGETAKENNGDDAQQNIGHAAEQGGGDAYTPPVWWLDRRCELINTEKNYNLR